MLEARLFVGFEEHMADKAKFNIQSVWQNRREVSC